MITIVCSSKEPSDEFKEHLIKTCGLGKKNVEILHYENKGKYSLTELYNKALKKASNDVVVFCHDDINIDTKQWGRKIMRLFERNPEYGIIGVAGSKSMPVSGQWWEDKSKMYGRVAHTHEGRTWLSKYSEDLGKELEEVVIVDGVFFAVDRGRLKADFNKEVKGFHFYEITFCFENYLKGVKLGVTTEVRVNHKSIGMTNDSWEENRKTFADKFKDNLPVNVVKVLRKGEKYNTIVSCLRYNPDSVEGVYILKLINKLQKERHNVILVATVDPSRKHIMNKLGVQVFPLNEPPNFRVGDGKWGLQNGQGHEHMLSEPNKLYKVKEGRIDYIYANQKQVIDHLQQCYPDTDTTCLMLNEENGEPVINDNIKGYITLTEEDKKALVGNYGIDPNIISIGTYSAGDVKTPIKILTGWSNRGGSTTAFIALTNALNERGYDATLYGPHQWHLDKCKSAILDNRMVIDDNDRVIMHFMKPEARPAAKKVVLACHEKDLYEVGKTKQVWDEAVFLNKRHKEYHSDYTGANTIIPNLLEPMIKRDKSALSKIAGIIGSMDVNKQTHVSIERALEDGCEMVYVFGEPSGEYYETHVKPLCSDKVVVKGFVSNKQAMYDMIGCVYHSSMSEVACLVKDECKSTGTIFYGNDATDTELEDITNDEIIDRWVETLELG